MAGEIQVYGNDWCGQTFGLREYLTNSRLPYEYYDIDRDSQAKEFVLAVNDGKRRAPVVVVEEDVVVAPSVSELRRLLDEHNIRADSTGSPYRIAAVTPALRSRRG